MINEINKKKLINISDWLIGCGEIYDMISTPHNPMAMIDLKTNKKEKKISHRKRPMHVA